MADTGMTIGLIKALGGKPDPAVIEGAVSDWLDDHPEATTTVEDGSISYAKLNSALQETVDDVSNLKTQISNLPKAIGSNAESVDLDIADDDGNVILRLANGHIKTKNFDSSEVIIDAKRYGIVESNRFEEDLQEWTYVNCQANNGITLETESKTYCGNHYTNDSWYLRGVFEINTIGSIFGLVMESSDKGAIYLVDSEEGKITLYGQYNGLFTLPSVIATESIGFELLTGKRYILEVFKTGYAHKFTITDEQTQEYTSVFFDNAPQRSSTYYCGKGHGKPGVICFYGSVKATNIVYSVRNYPDARALFIGDSITEGTNLRATIDNRWCNLVAKELYDGNAFIMGSGGDTSSGVITRLMTAFSAGFKADIVIVLIGTNERNESGTIASWSNNINTIVGIIEANGAIPVICVPPLARENNQTIINMRDFILGKGYQTVRFDYATSEDRDGITFDQSCFTDDAHPNVEGSYKMYLQAVSDLHSL